MPINNREVKNILVVRNDRFGEFLLNIPCLRALRAHFTAARIILVVASYVKELAECVPFIDEVIVWDRVKHKLWQELNFVNLLRKRNFDIAIMLNPSKEFNIFTYLARIPVRVGYGRKWGFLLTDKIEDKKYLGEKHEIEYNLDLLGLLAIKTERPTLSLDLDNKALNGLIKEYNLEYRSNLVALHPWTSDPIKEWPINNFILLAKRILKELEVTIIVIGGKDEIAKGVEFFDFSNNNLINLTGKTSLRQLAGLLKKSKLLISGDSGPVHLASCLAIPVVAIFRNDLPAKGPIRWGPWGEGNVVIEKAKICDITVDEVFNKVKEKLSK